MKTKYKKIMIGMVFLVLASAFILPELLKEDIEIVSRERIPTYEFGDVMYVCKVDFKINGYLISNYNAPEYECDSDEMLIDYLVAKGDSIWNEPQVQANLRVPQYDKIVHPSFTIEWNEITESVEIKTNTQTIVLNDLVERIETLENEVDLLK